MEGNFLGSFLKIARYFLKKKKKRKLCCHVIMFITSVLEIRTNLIHGDRGAHGTALPF